MYGQFLNIDPPKQQRIINAAMAEFSQYGYNNTSTNAIVAAAEISKGALFHYFKNKQQLFQFLFDYAIDLIMRDYNTRIDYSERDIFRRLEQIMTVKFELMRIHPDLIEFLKTAMTDSAPEVKQYVTGNFAKVKQTSYEQLLANIDYSLFREGINIKEALQVMVWTYDGLANETIMMLKIHPEKEYDWEELYQKGAQYTALLRQLFYQQED
ncbi:TetR/AcrR family transcriptional regulator [Culicoidibacter larvae]|uniref:TetR/AcrR family transcriptional regulator n=1 Tax=Culicoidibacter larvae TaxID=2579976 RepID=A0A5R8QBE9_9FIRM|nr:TetR/AcrR family transcriptional regulator [Culicoidibacter larvae]TLG72921.1 TetR/AcrR family transcriptional regulator [Culicoidibacter larvae]